MGDSEIDWYVREHGGGVIIVEPKNFGRVLVHDIASNEDLIFIARAELP